jgi:hypothetical protein
MYQDLIKSKTEEILPEVLSFDTESRHLFMQAYLLQCGPGFKVKN